MNNIEVVRVLVACNDIAVGFVAGLADQNHGRGGREFVCLSPATMSPFASLSRWETKVVRDVREERLEMMTFKVQPAPKPATNATTWVHQSINRLHKFRIATSC
ncbi:hypothetical protein D3C87_1619800 [compost metagenome]